MNSKRIVHFGLTILCLLLTSACFLTNQTSQQEPIADLPGEVEPQQENEPESVLDSSSQSCFEARSFILNVDHTLTINQPQTSLTHILKQGGIAITAVCNDGQGDCSMHTVAAQTLNYEYMGVVGDCSVDAAGNVILSAEGYCQDGIVYLTITEDWQPTQGTMTCDDTAMPFPIPGNTSIHSGPNGQGEEFLIINDTEGYTVMREFLGGEGYHSWTLITDIDIVPLVTGED